MKFKVLVFSLLLLAGTAAGFSFESFETKGKAAVIQLEGTIKPSSGGGFGSQGITPGMVRDLNSKAVRQGADAIIYEWNSGGGAVVASKEMMRAIEAVDVPTVCRFRDVAASGAYLASLGCDRIIADSASITGSIGVKSSYLEFSGLLDRYGVEYVNISSGKYKSLGSRYRNISSKEKEILENLTEKIHMEFLNLVDGHRNVSEKELETVSTGRVFLGEKAEKLGLVDRLGGRKTALETAENLTGRELKIFEVQQKPGFSLLSLLSLDSWITNFGSSSTLIEAEL